MVRVNGLYIEVLMYRYRERQGGNFAVTKPASVGFHMHLLEGNILKKLFVFDKEQKPLSENPLGVSEFIKERARWVTVDQLAKEGVKAGLKAILEKLP
jgi:hypothetical protein